MKQRKRNPFVVVMLCVCLFGIILSGCADHGGSREQNAVSEESPALKELDLKGTCEGGEQNQYIIADLRFDQKISYDDKLAEQIRIVVGGQRVKEDRIFLSSPQEKCLEIKIHVNQVNDGVLEITNAPGCSALTALTDDSGKNCVESIDIKKLIPSGAVISRVPSDGAEAIYQVDSIVTHRSIIWLRLFDGGNTVIPDHTDTTDVMEGAAAVHQHEFLWATPESTASDMAETINNFYSSGYEASADGNRLIIKRKEASANSGKSASGVSESAKKSAEVRLEIYEGE